MDSVTKPQLQPGDVLLYSPSGLFGTLIMVKTWHKISHVEVYAGARQSIASRDGIGVGMYPVRFKGLVTVMRPEVPFDLDGALGWFAQHEGQPYGWLDLLQFAGLNVNGPGMVCSPCATEVLRAGGVPVFNDEPAIKVAPFQFRLSELLTEIGKEVRL